MAPSSRDFGLLFVLSLIWGSSFALIKVAVQTLPPFTVAGGRIAVAFLALYILMRLKGERLPFARANGGGAAWTHFTVIGILGNALPFTLISWGETRVTSSLAAILIGVMPLFTVLFATITRVEPPGGARRLLGIGAGFAGLVLLVGPAVLAELGGAVAAQLAVALAAAGYASAGVYARGLALHLPITTLATGTMAASALVMVPLACALERPWALGPAAGGIAAVTVLGVVSTALASLVYFRLLLSAGPTFASMINYLIPVIGTITGIVWLGESLAWTSLAALVLILSGIALVRGRASAPPPGQAVNPSTSAME